MLPHPRAQCTHEQHASAYIGCPNAGFLSVNLAVVGLALGIVPMVAVLVLMLQRETDTTMSYTRNAIVYAA